MDAAADHHCQSPRFDSGNPLAERGIRRALWLTAVMMVVEIAGGWWFNSMAVLADGWHMSSHALALGLSAFAYSVARRQALHRIPREGAPRDSLHPDPEHPRCRRGGRGGAGCGG